MANQQVVVISTEQFKQEMTLARPHIEKMLPQHLDYDRFEGMVISVVAGTPKLRECTQASLLKAVIDGADTGLSLNPILREADILPVWSPGGQKAQFRPRAIGLMKLARQTGEVIKIEAEAVYMNDQFDYDKGLNPDLTHKPLSLKERAQGKERGELIGAYCVWQLKDGTKQFEVLDLARIHRARASSEAYKYATKNQNSIDTSTPWIKHEEEMVRKTAIRAASKYMPQSSEDSAFLKALKLDEDAEMVHEGEFAEVKADAADDAPSSGKTQVSSLEARLGVGGGSPNNGEASRGAQAGESQGEGQQQSQETAQAADDQGRGQETKAPAASRSRTRKSSASADAGSADTAPKAEPKPPAEDHSARDQEVKDALPQDDSAGWEDEKPKIDWKAKAHDLRKALIAIGGDMPAWSAWLTTTTEIRAQMAQESPEWHTRLQKEIDGKNAYFKSRGA